MRLQELQKKIGNRTYEYAVVEYPDQEQTYVGLDSKNRACLFLKSKDNAPAPSIKTEKLQVEFNREYSLHIAKHIPVAEKYHSILCLSESPEDNEMFLEVVSSILADPTNELNARSIAKTFYTLSSLFQTKVVPEPTLERQGLWGELLFMKHFGGFKKWAALWHMEPTRLFDYSYDSEKHTEKYRIEIKTTISPERKHRVKHRQICPLSSEEIYLVSILLRPQDTGTSLKDLIEEAKKALKNKPEFIKLQKESIKCAMTGSDAGPKFDETEALEKIAFYPSERVPRHPNQEPEGVSDTHYQVNLTNAQKMTPQEVEELIKIIITAA